jgi:hypothetical protein
MGRNILAHEFISIFVAKKRREAKNKMINPSQEPHQVTKQKKKTTNKDPYSTSFVNKKKIIKEEKTKTTFYHLVKSQML